MRAIALKDYLRVVGMIVGCLGFLALILAMEWHRAEDRSKIAGLAICAGFSLLSIRPLVIYWPRNIDVSSLKIVRGPEWSSTCIDTRFVWVEVQSGDRTKRIRLVDDPAVKLAGQRARGCP